MPDDQIPRQRPGSGQRSALPEAFYEAEQAVIDTGDGLEVPFHGEDGRKATFSFKTVPCPALHPDLAEAFASHTGPTGGRRTRSSAAGVWAPMRRFATFLAEMDSPPSTVAELSPSHFDRFRLHRANGAGLQVAAMELREVRGLFKHVPGDRLSAEVRDYLERPLFLPRRVEGRPGYSEREWQAIIAAARSEVVAIRQRIDRSERLLERFEQAPEALSADERQEAEKLAAMAATGRVPMTRLEMARGRGLPNHSARVADARKLFLTDTDLIPLMILGVCLTGRNSETVKDLPAEHRLLDGRAVAVSVTKRRRGKTAGTETVHWEVGANESRQLHTPGGWYQLVHRLAARGRQFGAGTRVWSIWTPENLGSTESKARKAVTHGHIDPFAETLSRAVSYSKWAAERGIVTDDGSPLELTLNRLKTSAEVRLVKAVGGHLPSARRTNSMDVSFRSYLRGDPIIREWADEQVTEALKDAEDSARRFGLRVLDEETTKRLQDDPDGTAAALGTSPDTLRRATSGELDTLASACLDHDHGPDGEGPCSVSFLTCLRCPNVLVAERHLPALLTLRDWLQGELDRIGVDEWCERHATNWLIVTRLVLPRFTDAQRQKADQDKPDTLNLHLLDGPREDQ